MLGTLDIEEAAQKAAAKVGIPAKALSEKRLLLWTLPQRSNATMTKLRRKRLPMLRMYKLPDGTMFFNAGKFDGSGHYWGHIHHATEDRLIFKVFHRLELEQSELVPLGQESWRWGDYSFNGDRLAR